MNGLEVFHQAFILFVNIIDVHIGEYFIGNLKFDQVFSQVCSLLKIFGVLEKPFKNGMDDVLVTIE